jgi:hypothetical protein
VSELTFALNVDEEAAELRLDDVLAGRDKPAAKPAKAAAKTAKATKAAPKPVANGAEAAKPAKAAAKTTKATTKK